MGRVAVHPFPFAVGNAGIGHRLSQAHVERVYHAVGGVKPAESLQDNFIHGAGGLAVNRRAGDALARQRHASTEQKCHRCAIVQPKYHRVLGDPLNFEQGPQRAEHVDHLQHQRHFSAF